MDKICRRCIALRNIIIQHNKLQRMSTLSLRLNPTPPVVSALRFYAEKNERASEKVYKHGKLIEEIVEDPLLYPHFLMIFTGTDETVLEGYLHFVKKAAKMVDVNLTQSFSMPATSETYKAKQDGKGLVSEVTYHLKRYQRNVELEGLTGDKSDIFLEYIQKSMPSGVQLEIQLQEWERYVDPNHIMFRKQE